MTAHILRIDLSTDASDFESLALEPGIPMLDRSGANYNVLRRWFGDLAAEPAWTDGAVRYYLRDAQHGRLANAVCLPATCDDLGGSLKASVEELLVRLNRVRPNSPHEQSLLRAARTSLASMSSGDDGGSQEGCFVKYREPGENWQLAWCWGYRRKDHQPAIALICTNPECRQLFLRAGKSKVRCPGCSGFSAPVMGRWKFMSPRNRVFAGLTSAAALLLIAFGSEYLGYSHYFRGNRHGATTLASAPTKNPTGEKISDKPGRLKANAPRQPSFVGSVDHGSSSNSGSNQDNATVASTTPRVGNQTATAAADKAHNRNKKASASGTAIDSGGIVTSNGTTTGAIEPAIVKEPTTLATPVVAAADGITPATVIVPKAVVAPDQTIATTAVRRGNAMIGAASVDVTPNAVVGGTVHDHVPLATAISPSTTLPATLIGDRVGVDRYAGGVAPVVGGVAVGGTTVAPAAVKDGAIEGGAVGKEALLHDSAAATNATGNPSSKPPRSNEARAIYEVKLVGIRTQNTSPQSFRAVLDLELAQQGRYRLIDDQQHALSDWKKLGPGGVQTLVSEPLARVPADEYELFVERQIDGQSKLYRATFQLSRATPQTMSPSRETQKKGR